MQEKNELNDIILNKESGVNGNKKILLVVATLGVILIIVIMLMNSLTSKGTDNLPQAVLPPEPKTIGAEQAQEEPLFEDVDVVEEESKENKNGGENLDKIAQRLKEESKTEIVPEEKPSKPEKTAPAVVEKPAPAVVEKKPVKVRETKILKASSTSSYFIQVGSFSKYEPDTKFLKSITDKGYKYQYYKVSNNAQSINKVLVGPFNSEKDARSALRTIRSSIESGAFLIKI